MVLGSGVGFGFVGKPNAVVRGKTDGGVAGVINPGRAVLAIGVVFGVADGEVVSPEVLDFVEGPESYGGFALGFDAGVVGGAVFAYGAVFAPDFEGLGAVALGPIRDDFLEGFAFGAVFGAVGSVGTCYGDQALAVEAVFVVIVVVDPALLAINGDGRTTALDEG